MRAFRLKTKLLLAAALLAGVPYWWLLIDNHAGNVPDRRIDLAALRSEANRLPGARPTSIDYEIVAMRRIPGTYMVAGTGLKRRLLGTLVYRIHTPDGTILINAGVSAGQCRKLHCESYFPDRQKLVDEAMRRARMILFTSEDLDHIGGLLTSHDWPALAPKVVLNSAQMPGAAQARTLPWPADRSGLAAPVADAPAVAVAPGIVLLRTAGHSPGSQMIYVQLANGREFLFAGDVAPFARNLAMQRVGSRLLTDWKQPEDRAEQAAWLKALQDAMRQAPTLFVVPAHDPEFLVSRRGGRPFKLHFDGRVGVPAGVATDDPGDN